MDGTTKSPLQSLTVVTAAASSVLSLLAAFGVKVDPQLIGDATTSVTQLGAAVLAAAAVYGRLRATTRIGGG